MIIIIFQKDNCVANEDAYYSSIFQRPRGWIGILMCIFAFISFIFYNKSLITRLTVFFVSTQDIGNNSKHITEKKKNKQIDEIL